MTISKKIAPSQIRERLSQVLANIRQYENTYQRQKDSVTLLAASKGQGVSKIRAAFLAGQRHFGENYVQEALAKINELADLSITWHFIGRIQSNKTHKIAENFAWVHSVADHKIAERLSLQRPNTLPDLNICLEVNIDHSEQKAGVYEAEVLELAQFCQALAKIKLRGLMCIPNPSLDFNTQREAFAKMHALYQQLKKRGIQLDTLSMGMSEDYEAAIAEGASIVRIGRAIFGARSKN